MWSQFEFVPFYWNIVEHPIPFLSFLQTSFPRAHASSPFSLSWPCCPNPFRLLLSLPKMWALPSHGNSHSCWLFSPCSTTVSLPELVSNRTASLQWLLPVSQSFVWCALQNTLGVGILFYSLPTDDWSFHISHRHHPWTLLANKNPHLPDLFGGLCYADIMTELLSFSPHRPPVCPPPSTAWVTARVSEPCTQQQPLLFPVLPPHLFC